MVAFTDTALRAIPLLSKGQKTYWDPSLPSFGLRVSRGSKAFVLKRRNRWITIGRFPLLGLSQARQEAKHLLAEFTLGRVRPQALPYPTAVKLFIEEKGKSRRQRTVGDYERLLGRVSFGQLSEIDHNAIGRALKPFTAPSEYNHILVALKVFLSWCRKRRYIEHSPADGFSQHAVHSRSRILSDHEIIAIWKATEEPKIFHSIVRLLLLTGQRCGEIAALEKSWINEQEKTLTIPAKVAKNARESVVPIGHITSSLIASAISKSASNLLFPARGRAASPFNGWSKASAALWKVTGIKGATLHDIRRTYRSNLGRIGVAPHLAERLVNHISSRSAVDIIYDRYTYLDEMRRAVDSFEKFLLSIFATGA